MSPRRKKLWSFSAGEYGNVVQVFERTEGGNLYAKMWDPTLKRQDKVSLRHKDRDRAMKYAVAESLALRDGAAELTAAPTVGFVLTQYSLNRTPQKATTVQREDRRRTSLWRRFLGNETLAEQLGRAEWERFIALRQSGTINPHGEPVAEALRVGVGARAVDADLVFMVSVLNWSLSWTVNGKPLLDRNPWGAHAPGVKRALERPTSDTVLQPVATFDRFLIVRKAATRVLTEAAKNDPAAKLITVGSGKRGPVKKWMKPSYLPELLDLVEDTGRRISAICRLWYSDIIREGRKITKLRWRPIKGSKTVVIPVGKRTRAALERVLRQRPGIGDRPIFPSPRHKPGTPIKAITRFTARDWLERAEDLAKVEHVVGGDWHPYRRAWATSRKHLPTRDVMEVGGWLDERSLKASYQQVDQATVLAVVNEPRKLRARGA